MNGFRLKGIWGNQIYRAKRGEKEAARKIATELARVISEGETLPDEARDYLVTALEGIGHGERADKAFHTAGRRGVNSSANRRLEAALWDLKKLEMLGWPHGESAAIRAVATRHHFEESTIRKPFKKWQKQRAD